MGQCRERGAGGPCPRGRNPRLWPDEGGRCGCVGHCPQLRQDRGPCLSPPCLGRSARPGSGRAERGPDQPWHGESLYRVAGRGIDPDGSGRGEGPRRVGTPYQASVAARSRERHRPPRPLCRTGRLRGRRRQREPRPVQRHRGAARCRPVAGPVHRAPERRGREAGRRLEVGRGHGRRICLLFRHREAGPPLSGRGGSDGGTGRAV